MNNPILVAQIESDLRNSGFRLPSDLVRAVLSHPDLHVLIDQAVAEAEARMREHYRPAVLALGILAWEQHGRLSVPGPMARTMLAEWGITGPLADECIAAAEAES